MQPATKIATLKTSTVYHVGTMSPAHKAQAYRSSMEGHCLSVSHCPEAWRHIARLGDVQTHRLTKKDGVFIDALSLARQHEVTAQVERWGEANGLCIRKPIWKAWGRHDDDSLYYTLHETQAEAQAHGDEDEDCPPPERCSMLAASTQLCALLRMDSLDGRDCLDMLLLAWVDLTQPHVDGLWWRERYAPLALSAPRGGILPSRLHRWDSQELPAPCRNPVYDDGMPMPRKGSIEMRPF